MSTHRPAPDRSPRVSADAARRRILDATRKLLLERSFAELTVGSVMAEAGLARTVFYRHFDDLPELAPELLPDADDPLVDQVRRADDRASGSVVEAIVDGQIALYAAHGRLLRAIVDAASHDAEVATELDKALVEPRALLTALLRDAANPPPDPEESARLLMATHRAYLLDVFGDGCATKRKRAAARAALLALWERLLG